MLLFSFNRKNCFPLAVHSFLCGTFMFNYTTNFGINSMHSIVNNNAYVKTMQNMKIYREKKQVWRID